MILDDIMSNGWDAKKSVDRIMSLLHEISPLQRMIISPGLDEAFKIVKHELPETIIHEYPTGSKCGDWEVPESWEINEAFMKNKDGNIIASFDESPLFVCPFSEPIDGWFSKKEIQNHLTTNKKRPNEFLLEHRNAYDYQLKDWGITLPYDRWSKLADEKYHINISILLGN